MFLSIACQRVMTHKQNPDAHNGSTETPCNSLKTLLKQFCVSNSNNMYFYLHLKL